MTEEIIINEKSLQAVLKRYDELEQENENLKKEVKQIGSDFIKKGDYARELEQENKELKEQLLEDKILDEHIEILSREDIYRSALEEIRTYLNTLSSIDNDFPNTETYLRIQDKINEVIND